MKEDSEASICWADGDHTSRRTDEALGQSTTDMLADLSLAETEKRLSEKYLQERKMALDRFVGWSEQEQVDFVKMLIHRMCHDQHGQIDSFLKPILQRDFISLLPERLARYVLSYLDAKWLSSSEMVSRSWRRVIAHGKLWRRLIERNVATDPVWKGISEKRGWQKFLFISKENAHTLVHQEMGYDNASIERLRGSLESLETQHRFYRDLYPRIYNDIESLKANWRSGWHVLSRITCHSEPSRGVYCLQYDDEKIISGLRDHTIKIWQRNSLQCSQTLRGHTGSVLCLQYDDRVIISGSSDTTVRVWDVHTGELLHTLLHHVEAVLHLRFQNGIMVTCSKDRSIAVWDMVSPCEINVRRVLVAHRAAVNVVDFDSKYIVSASGDRTIKVWSTDSCEFVRTLIGHRRGIACLQYHDRLVVSGSSDNTIRLWDIEIGACLRTLEGHEQLVRCIRFDSKRIVSGAYDGRIKVWDLQAALNPRSPPESICLLTLVEHTGRVFRLQFDEFQIVSSSHDDTIVIWDFLDPHPDIKMARNTTTNGNQQTSNDTTNNHHHHHHHLQPSIAAAAAGVAEAGGGGGDMAAPGPGAPGPGAPGPANPRNMNRPGAGAGAAAVAAAVVAAAGFAIAAAAADDDDVGDVGGDADAAHIDGAGLIQPNVVNRQQQQQRHNNNNDDASENDEEDMEFADAVANVPPLRDVINVRNNQREQQQQRAGLAAIGAERAIAMRNQNGLAGAGAGVGVDANNLLDRQL